MGDYEAFLARKQRSAAAVGRQSVECKDIHPILHDWQAEISAWAVRRGRAALFADCGLGKTFMQLEGARLIADRSLIVAPLSVARQTVREAAKLDSEVTYARTGTAAVGAGVWITHYEMVDRFDLSTFEAVVLDESSILKNVDGKTRQRLTSSMAGVPYRLACTATPAPNDVAELCNHAEFLGVMPRAEMLAAFFVHDEIGWRLKGHAVEPMYRWMGSWSCALRKPSDIGYADDGYELPPLHIHEARVDGDIEAEGQMFATDLGGVGGRQRVRRVTLDARCERAIELCADAGQWIVWCGLNDEAKAIARAVDGAVNVPGAWTPDQKAEALEAFQDGSIRVLVTKPSIAGFGMNFQNCHRMVFVGLNDSWESYYQAIRRCYRFGQTQDVHVYVVVSQLEHQIVVNIRRKEAEAQFSASALVRYSPIGRTDEHRPTAIHYRRVPRRMLASTTRR